ncbi:MAG: HEPN domain-containing protein [Candidatus Bathyarchaeaceae archaeon]
MSEIDDLLRKAQRKLGAAKKLLELGEYEDAVSRAYYCIFHAAKAALASENLFPKTHEGALREFGLRFVKERRLSRELGVIFSDAKSLRETADYALRSVLGLEDAEWIVGAAERFLKEVSEYLKKPS